MSQKGKNSGNYHEMMTILYVSSCHGVTDAQRNDASMSRKVSLLNSQMTGLIELSETDTEIIIAELEEINSYSFRVIKDRRLSKTTAKKMIDACQNDFDNLQKDKTASVVMPKSFLDALEFFGFKSDFASSEDAFDFHVVMAGNYDHLRHEIMPTSNWESVSCKSLFYGGSPTLLNASQHIYVHVELCNFDASSPLVEELAKGSHGVGETLGLLEAEGVTFKAIPSAFLNDIFGEQGAAVLVEAWLKSHLPSKKASKRFAQLFLNNKDRLLIALGIKKCALGATPSRYQKNGDINSPVSTGYGHVMFLKNKRVMSQTFSDASFATLLIESAAFDTPSLKRHSKNKDRVLLHQNKDFSGWYLHVPFQIRLK